MSDSMMAVPLKRAASRLTRDAMSALISAAEKCRSAGAADDMSPHYSAETIDGAISAVANALTDRSLAGLPRDCRTRAFIREVRQELMLSPHVRSDLIPPADLRRLLCALDAVEDAAAEAPASCLTSSDEGLQGAEYMLAAVHDLRSPLGSILLLVDSLRNRSGGPLTDIQQRQLNLVYGAALGLSITSSNILEALRKDESGQDSAHPMRATAFSVTEVLYGVRDIVMPVAEERNVELTLGLPINDARYGHPTLLSRVLLNLVSNALRETENGSVELSVSEIGADLVEYRVRDTGSGMDPDMVARLFRPMQREHCRPHEWLASSGLGLAICRRLVEVMKGRIRAESAPGSGTVITCLLRQAPA